MGWINLFSSQTPGSQRAAKGRTDVYRRTTSRLLLLLDFVTENKLNAAIWIEKWLEPTSTDFSVCVCYIYTKLPSWFLMNQWTPGTLFKKLLFWGDFFYSKYSISKNTCHTSNQFLVNFRFHFLWHKNISGCYISRG